MIVEFFRGVAGAISGLVSAKHDPKKTPSRKTARSGTVRRSSTNKNRVRRVHVKRRSTHRRNPRIDPLPVEPATSSPTSIVPAVFSTCPACGLQAPESLLAEHFSGSPTHRNGRIDTERATHDDPPEAEALIASEDESTALLRHLLQMLVPPRAFGRRHEQKTVNPLLQVVQPLSHGGEI